MPSLLRIVLIVWAVLFGALQAEARQTAPLPHEGRIKAAVGSVTLVRAGQLLTPRVGDVVFVSDVLRTGTDGQLALMLKDDTRLSLGPGTEVVLAEFAFAPAENKLALLLRVVRGALSYVSGRITKLSPEAVRIETPWSIIGVRGSHLLVKVEAP